jgi:hypothetical protein
MLYSMNFCLFIDDISVARCFYDIDSIIINLGYSHHVFAGHQHPQIATIDGLFRQCLRASPEGITLADYNKNHNHYLLLSLF